MGREAQRGHCQCGPWGAVDTLAPAALIRAVEHQPKLYTKAEVNDAPTLLGSLADAVARAELRCTAGASRDSEVETSSRNNMRAAGHGTSMRYPADMRGSPRVTSLTIRCIARAQRMLPEDQLAPLRDLKLHLTQKPTGPLRIPEVLASAGQR